VTGHEGKDLEALWPYDVTVRDSFAAFLREHGDEAGLSNGVAVKGVLGMMRFGKHDSPVLLEALGSLLVQDGHALTSDAKLLAARAFLRASQLVREEPARAGYRAMAAQAIRMQSLRDKRDQILLHQVEDDFRRELAEGEAWYAELRDRELAWIRDGQNPEEAFDKLYAADPEVSGMDVADPMSPDERLARFAIGAAAVVVLVVILLVIVAVRVARRAWGN
jgi:hypothetical protein